MTERAKTPATRSDGPAHINVQSRATRVTLFEDRAEVLRAARAAVPAGVSLVRVAGVSTMVDDPSALCNVRGGLARVLATRVLRRVRQVPAATAEEVEHAEADYRAAFERRIAAERAQDAATSQEQRCAQLLDAWIAALTRVPRDAAKSLGGWRTAYQLLLDAVVKGLDGVAAAQKELDDARLDETRANLRRQHARRLQPRYEAAVELQIESATAAELQLELCYRVPCALWRPEHRARLVFGEGGVQLQITTWATVWQRTGEEWQGVSCRFSTARPAQSATPPLLTEDRLMLRRKTDAEKRTVVVEAREQAIAVAGLGRGQTAVEDMPGVDDGGEPLVYEALRPASLPSSGQPTRVEIASVTVPCTVERVAFPERGQVAHLRATATLLGPRPLLAGPVHVVRGSELVGRGRIGFVGRGEPFELGFGPDDGLRVRRSVDETREVGTLSGAQKVTRTVRLFVSNLGGTRRRLLVTERVPVSELREVEIAVTQTSGMRFDPKDGFAHFDLELDGRATRELQFTYRIDAPARVVLPAG